MKMVMWNVYGSQPVYDGKIKNALGEFRKYSNIVDIPDHDEAALREAKIKYLELVISAALKNLIMIN